jgi:hemoglobin
MSIENNSQKNEFIDVNGVLFSNMDIFTVINDFYGRIQTDPILQVPFKSVEDWPEHIKNITHFWWVKFGGRAYMFNQYNPVPKHFFAGFNRDLLSRWLFIFHQTLKTHLSQEQVTLWAMISTRMGEGLAVKNDHYKLMYDLKNGCS